MSKGFDLGGLLQQAKQLQERLTSVQDEIASRTVEGRAGGGMVTAVVNGRLEVLRVHIDPSLLESPDREMLQDLVVAAVNDAHPGGADADRRRDAEGHRGLADPGARLRRAWRNRPR